MSSQSDEYYIEAVSNASMDLFPENTLTKFTNRLHHPINLIGEWVVAIHEIFYPVDLVIDRKEIYLTLEFPDGQRKIKFEINEIDGLEGVIHNINTRLKEIYDEVISVIPAKIAKRESDKFDPTDDTKMDTLKLLAITDEEMEAMGSNVYRRKIQSLIGRIAAEIEKEEEVKKQKILEMNHKKTIQQLKQRIEIEEQLEEKKVKIKTKETEISEKNDIIANQRTTIDTLREEIKGHETKISAKDQEILMCKNAADEQNKIKTTFDEVFQRLDDGISKLIEIIDTQTSRKATAEVDILKYKNSLTIENEKLEKLTQEIKDKENELKKANEKLHTLIITSKSDNKSNEKIEEIITKPVEELKKVNEKLDEIISKPDEELKKLNEKLDVIASKPEEDLKKAHAKLDILLASSGSNPKVVDLQYEIVRTLSDIIRAKNESFNTTQSFAFALQRQLMDSERALVNSKIIIESKEKQLTAEREMKKLQQDEADRRLADYEKVIAEKNKRIEELEKEKTELIAQRDSANGQILTALNEISKLQAEIKEIKSITKTMNDALQTEITTNREQDKKVQAELDEIKTSIENIEKNIEKLTVKRKKVAKIIDNSIDINEPPEIVLKDDLITIKRGMYEDRKFIPKFDDPLMLETFGFSYDPSPVLHTQKKITARKTVDLNYGSHLIYVYSDIVAEHFVGQQSVRVLRVVPLKRGKSHDIVHERFVKPLYFPVRTNRIEEINFILGDETGSLVRFASGRVHIGLHLKRII
ncbi:myosin-11-like [Panonychus citri]|uniref:myosin-11-like n=1 Tax=Panonychus citri TaxID=50023 RepID=UPI0023075D75|nr:myosin-11-like [Panonychus citri]